MKNYKRVLGCFEQLEHRNLLSVSPGDANLDGVVNLADINAVIANYDQVGDWSKGDFDGDGKVGEADLSTALNHYGNYGATIKATTDANGDVSIAVVPNPEPVQTVKIQVQSSDASNPTDAYFTANIGQYAAGTHAYEIVAYDSLGNASDPYVGSFNVFMEGDANQDGTVDGADLVLVLNNYDKPGNWSAGDFTDDGMVNVEDLTKLLNNYNKSAPVSTGPDQTGFVPSTGLDKTGFVPSTGPSADDDYAAAVMAAENSTEKKDDVNTVKSNKGGGSGGGASYTPTMSRSIGVGGSSMNIGKAPFSQAVDRQSSNTHHASTIVDHVPGTIVGFNNLKDIKWILRSFSARK